MLSEKLLKGNAMAETQNKRIIVHVLCKNCGYTGPMEILHGTVLDSPNRDKACPHCGYSFGLRALPDYEVRRIELIEQLLKAATEYFIRKKQGKLW
jgi:hypothetical protein